MYGVLNHLGRYQLVITQESQLLALSGSRVLGGLGIQASQLVKLSLLIDVTQGQLFVQLGHGHIAGQLTLHLVHLACHGIGTCKPHTILITVVLKQQNNTDYFE